MAKRRGKRGKRGTRITFGPKGQVRRERKRSKRQKFISKISRDGKISKKEGRKAAKKGISLRKIQNRRISEYRKATRDFDRRGRADRTPAARRPTFEPLKIKRGAERADFARQMRDYEQRGGGRTRGGRRRGGRQGRRGDGRPSQQPTNRYQDEIKDILGGEPEQQVTTPGFAADPNQDYLDAIADLEATIAGLSFDAPDYSDELAAMKAQQEDYMRRLADQQAEQERQRELAFRTSQENAARGGMVADFRIGSRSPRNRMGTSGFVRRPSRRPATIAQGILPTTAGQTINV